MMKLISNNDEDGKLKLNNDEVNNQKRLRKKKKRNSERKLNDTSYESFISILILCLKNTSLQKIDTF